MKNKIIGFLTVMLILSANSTYAESVKPNIENVSIVENNVKKEDIEESSEKKVEEVKSETSVVENKSDWKKSVVILFYIVCLFTGGGIVFI